MPKFKNVSDDEQMVPGVGRVGIGEEVELPEDFNNVHFERVKHHPKQKPEETGAKK